MPIIQTFQKAALQVALTPQERALLRLIKSALLNAIAAIIVSLGLAFKDGGKLDYSLLLGVGIVAAVSTLLHGGSKLLSASSDPQIQLEGAALGQAASQYDQRYNTTLAPASPVSPLIVSTGGPTTLSSVGSVASTNISSKGDDPTMQSTGVQQAIAAQEQNAGNFTGN